MNIDYSNITDNPEVIELLKQRIELENKIKAIDETALIKHEIELLSLPDVVGQSEQLPRSSSYEPCEGCDLSCKHWMPFFCDKK